MSQTSFPNTLIYECSSENAEVKIASNEWINNFSEGIDLMPGDSVRILGSFINQKGSGDQIEITEDNNKFTMEYMPIHNLYQYTKLSDDYKKPNDDTRTKLEKFQYSQVLNFDTPRMYDGNGSQILPLKGTERADRWFDNLPWNTYHNNRGYDTVNPNTQYYDCELIKTIPCPYVDGIRLKWRSKDDRTVFQYQEILFSPYQESPYGGPKNPYVGDPTRQLAFGTVYSYFVWDGNRDNPTFTMESTNIPVGVTGKIIGLKYINNQGAWTDPVTTQEWDKNLIPFATFMVGDHTTQTKVDKRQINPTTEPYKSSTGMNGIWNTETDAKRDFDRFNNSPFFNAQDGPVNEEGQTWTLSDDRPDAMTSGFSSGNLDNRFKSCLNYNFYNTGPSTWQRDSTAFDFSNTNQQQIVPNVGISYDATSKKYFYDMELTPFWDNEDLPAFASKIYYGFLRAYDPDDMSRFPRVYLPISMSVPELTFVSAAGFDYGGTLTTADVGNGNLRYTDSVPTDSLRTTSGGVKVGNLGRDEYRGDETENNYGDKYQQTIKAGFQTNINMWDGTALTTVPGPEEYLKTPVELFTRTAGGYPSTKYEEQIQDILDYKQDCWMIQSKKANFEIPTGFYTPDRLANVINDLLHLNRKEYENKFGTGQVTLANRDDNWTYAPGYVNGPFVQTKIPEITGGIIPPDLSKENAENPSISNRPPGITINKNSNYTMYTYTLAKDGIDTLTLANDIANGTGQLSYPMADRYVDTNQMIFVPHPFSKIDENIFYDSTESYIKESSNNLISSDTPGQVLQNDIFATQWVDIITAAEREVPIFVGMGPYFCDGQPHDYSGTDFKPSTTGELGDGVLGRTQNLPFGNINKGGLASPTAYYSGFPSVVSYTNRTNGGILSGGLSRFFSGATDLTFLYDNDEERFAFSNTYTPFRPAGFESSQDKDEFTVDDAVPSVLINTIYNGYNLFAISSIYILSLAAPPVCVEASNPDDRQGIMPSIPDPIAQQEAAINFWSSLGFTDLPSYTKDSSGKVTITESRWLDDLFFQQDLDTQTGKRPISNVAEVNPSVNGANPAKSQCLTMVPNRQFLIQTISDEIKGPNPASLTTYPFYLIGSSIPSGFYHGSKTGTELPVVGICSRNFNAGSFVFDLSQSSVEWTISEKITMTSIHTKILKNNFEPATNLFGNSAVIYAITKNSFYSEIPAEISQKIEKDREDRIAKEVQEYESQPYVPQPVSNYMIPSYVYQELIDADESDSD